MFFSIIVPCYQSEKTLSKTLKSVFEQTWVDFEVIIVDAKSTDDTLLIANRFDNNAEQIKIISEKDRGIYDAMNKGIDMASGEWLYFMGSDDYFWDKDVLKDIVSSTKNKDVDIIYGNVFSPALGENYDGFFGKKKIVHSNICHQAIFYKKSVFTKKGYYNLKYKTAADHDFNLKCFLDDSIKKTYINRRIAFFASDGKSGQNIDLVFKADQPGLITTYGNKRLLKEYYKVKNPTPFQKIVRRFNKKIKRYLKPLK